MIYPGPGEVTYNLPPGSIEMPLQKNPHGGHLCLTVNDYAKAIAAKAANATILQSTQELTVSRIAAEQKARGKVGIQDNVDMRNVMSTSQMQALIESWNK